MNWFGAFNAIASFLAPFGQLAKQKLMMDLQTKYYLERLQQRLALEQQIQQAKEQEMFKSVAPVLRDILPPAAEMPIDIGGLTAGIGAPLTLPQQISTADLLAQSRYPLSALNMYLEAMRERQRMEYYNLLAEARKQLMEKRSMDVERAKMQTLEEQADALIADWIKSQPGITLDKLVALADTIEDNTLKSAVKRRIGERALRILESIEKTKARQKLKPTKTTITAKKEEEKLLRKIGSINDRLLREYQKDIANISKLTKSFENLDINPKTFARGIETNLKNAIIRWIAMRQVPAALKKYPTADPRQLWSELYMKLKNYSIQKLIEYIESKTKKKFSEIEPTLYNIYQLYLQIQQQMLQVGGEQSTRK